MQINSGSSKNNTFCAKPIFKIALKSIAQNGSTSILPARFSELSKTSPEDIVLMQNIEMFWRNNPENRNLAVQMAINFLKGFQNFNKFFITELVGEGDLFQRTKSIMQVTNPQFHEKSLFAVEFLQSKSSLDNSFPKIKGAGEMSIYGAVKLAKDNNFKCVYIHSLANSFYKKIGLEPTVELDGGEGFFVLENKDFDIFLKNIANKYFLKK